jgi:hypothetical protein
LQTTLRVSQKVEHFHNFIVFGHEAFHFLGVL